MFITFQNCVVPAGAPPGSRHYYCHYILLKLWPSFLRQLNEPLTFSSATLPPEIETTQRNRHPPAALTAWTTFKNNLLSLLIVSFSPRVHVCNFFFYFLYAFVCSFGTPFRPVCSVSFFIHFFPSSLLLFFYYSFSDPITHVSGFLSGLLTASLHLIQRRVLSIC